MGRHAAGPKLYRDPRSQLYYVRFTHKGRRYFEPTGTRDLGEAESKKPVIYAEVVQGRRRKVAHGSPNSMPLDSLLVEWIEAIESSMSDLVMAHCYARKFKDFFVTLGHAADSAMWADYRRLRLRQVKRTTVLKELSAGRTFTAWCQEQGKIEKAPLIEAPAKNVTGKADTKRKHKAKATKITPAEARAILAELPTWSTRARRGEKKHLIRDFFVVLWETGLRPVTVGRIRAPEHYRIGGGELFLPKELDKARFERSVPLTVLARFALDEAYRQSERGKPIFGSHRYEVPLAKALAKCVAKGTVTAERAAIISIYDFRHGRTTDLVSQTKNLAGVAYLVGHRHVSTTSKYVEGAKAGAAEILAGLEDT